MSITFRQFARQATSVILVALLSACGQSQLPNSGAAPPAPLTLHSSLQSRANIVPNLYTA